MHWPQQCKHYNLQMFDYRDYIGLKIVSFSLYMVGVVLFSITSCHSMPCTNMTCIIIISGFFPKDQQTKQKNNLAS